MGRRDGPKRRAGHYLLGLYQSLLAEAREAVEYGEPRLAYGDFAPSLTEKQRALVRAESPVTTAAQRRLASLEAREPQLIPLWAISPRQFPDADMRVPFLALKVHDTAEERAESPTLLRVFADDRVEVGQTYAQQ